MSLLDPAPANRPTTVSQLTAQLRLFLEERFQRVWVEGEISNWTLAASGHAYFALKDEGALLSAVMWRSAVGKAGGAFRDGDRVEARGRLSVYDRRGQYQLVVDSLKPLGEGLLFRRFLELKEKLEREGLFDPGRKRAIPALPGAVGVVTSPTGAAIRDILSVLQRRAPGLPVFIWPARVQGDGAAAEIAAGVHRLSRSGLVDVLIVGRGGGSLEDLWEFNNEALAREIVAAPIPVISAVGHEVDFSISDFVADLRAPTPSAAAELVCADHAAFLDRVRECVRALDRAATAPLVDARHRLRAALSSYGLREPEARLRLAQQRADDSLRRLDAVLDRRVAEVRHRVAAARSGLGGHDPALILKKGYAIVRTAKEGRVVTHAGSVRKGAHIRTELVDGTIRSVVTDDVPDLFE
ncbi:MAG: exodeoxyribonuclease large subunit [Candidatus Sumerlaeota bacterium]|nr:exodeoxyribonuclease large subunit [Candidatus Sumerlaeota bacterium]